MNPARAEPPRRVLGRREGAPALSAPPPLRRPPARAEPAVAGHAQAQIGNAAIAARAVLQPATLEPAADARLALGNAALAQSLATGDPAEAAASQPAASGAPQTPARPAEPAVPAAAAASEAGAESTAEPLAAGAAGALPGARGGRPQRAPPARTAGESEPAAPPEALSLSAFSVEAPPPLSAPAALPPFEAPTWNAAALRPSAAATQDRDKAQDSGAAVARAGSRYGEALALARQRHGEVTRHAQDVQRGLAASCQHLVDSLPGEVERIDAAIDAPLQQNLQALDAAANEADALVVAAHRRARRMLYAAVSHGRDAVAANLATAELQIVAIVAGLSARYAQTLNDAAGKCQQAADLACVAINAWERGAPDAYPAGVGGVAEAENETKRRTVTQRASATASQLSERGIEAAAGFQDQVEPVRTSIGGSVEPALRTQVAEIGEHGQQAVNDAYSQASDALRDQARQARDSVETMRKDTRARVFARRRAARARIEAIGTRAGKDAQRETEAAQRSLGGSLLPTLSVYGKTLVRVQAGLADAAPRGTSALDRTSDAANQSVEGVTGRAVSAQSERLESTRAGVEAGMVQRARQGSADAEVESQGAKAEMAERAQADLPVFADSARQQTEGFSLMSAGIRAATEQWSQPLSETFRSYIDEVQLDLDRRHDEAVDGQPAFVTQVDEAKRPFMEWATPMQQPATHFAPALVQAWAGAFTDLRSRARNAGSALSSGIIDVVDEPALSRALRNITAAQGTAIRAIFADIRGRPLNEMLQFRVMTRDLNQDEYELALTYLSGNAREGNRLELDASRGWINDDEARMEEVLRSLTRAELDALHATEGWEGTAERVRGVLGGTDLDVFDALDAGRPARADALRWRDRMNEARARGEIDSLHDVAAEYGGAATYMGSPVDAAERRRMVNEEFGTLLRESGAVERGEVSAAALAEGADPADAVVEYATRSTEVLRNDWLSGPEVVREGVSGPNRDLFGDIVRHGEESVQARQSRLAVEFGREGGPNMLRLDRALVDPRLNPNFYPGGVIPEETLREARADRDAVATGFAQRYGGASAGEHPSARAYVSSRIDNAFGSDTYGASIAGLLLYEEVPSPETASHMMRYAMTHEAGTNEALMDRVVGRMNRDEIAAMTLHYNSFGSDLHEDLGVHGSGWMGELSGDERLSMEVKLLGVPRNDRERAEVAAFTAQQQRDETGWLGGLLTSGDFQDQALAYEADHLARVSGIKVGRNPDGTPSFSGGGAQFHDGNYVGADRAEFEASTAGAVAAAQAYSARVDAYANFAANAIMVIGAVAATVLTAGGAGPLLLAAVAAGTGLTAMAARAMISGGRYGWEQALTDLGATLVQTLTAGLGASLSLASRGGSAAVGAGMRAGLTGRIPQHLLRANMGRLTGTALGDTLLIGAGTNALNTAGTTALSESTWEKGLGHGIGELFTGSLTGAFTGVLGAGIGHGLSAIRPGQIPGLSRLVGAANLEANIGEMLGRASPLVRGVGQGGIGAMSGFGSRFAELAIQAGRGRYRGDAGDMFTESAEAGAQAGLQGFGEGVGEAHMERHMERRMERATLRDASGAEPGGPLHDAQPVPARGLHAEPDASVPPGIDAPVIARPLHAGAEPFARPGAGPEAAPARATPPLERAAGGALPPRRGGHEGDGSGGDGSGRPRRPLGPPEDDRLFPNLSDAEIDAAFADAESGSLVRLGADRSGADTRPLAPPEANLANLQQRQRADDLLDRAGTLASQAEGLVQRAIAAETRADAAHEHNPRRARALRDEATRLLDQAAALEARAVALRGEAAEFASGRRSATADLPGPDDLDAHFDSLHSDAPGLLHIGLSELERHPELLPRLVRSLLAGEGGGRMVFRVESERSRSLVSVDADGNVRVAGGAAVHLNFGSFERAVEFVMEHSQGHAHIIAFEVEEAWVRAARSAAIPEGGTAALGGRQPRVVDVRFAHDQLEIPGSLIPELNRFILPGSGVVIELPMAPTRGGPDGDAGPVVPLHPSDEHADAMRQALLRHVPPEHHAGMAEVPVVVLPHEQYRALTRSESGPVVTVIRDGRPTVIVREGTSIARLADEGPHLSQAREASTRARVARLDEATLARWDSLDLDTQIGLYHDKIELEIDAHERIVGSLDREAAQPGADPARVAAERERAEGTLRNLRARLGEVQALGPQQRSDIASGAQPRPQYLDQPARLFSKDAAAGAPAVERQRRVFEPFTGPSLDSARELQQRHPDAEVIGAEASRPPSGADVAAFEAGGGRFLGERFGESLPDNHLDLMYVRFPLPHEKAQEMMIDSPDSAPGGAGAESPTARRAAVEQMMNTARARQAEVESLTNLAPHALRTLRPGGEMEVVFHEPEIGAEVARLTGQEWQDASGRRYRLEVVDPVHPVPRSVAPHSEFGVPPYATQVSRVVLRKVRVVSEVERAAGRAAREDRRREERSARPRQAAERAEAQHRAQAQRAAREAHDSLVRQERSERAQALAEGRVTPVQDLHQRLAAVAARLHLPPHHVARLAQVFVEQLGGSGRRINAQEVIDSLRNRLRDGRPPRYGDLDNLVSEIIIEQNAVAVQQMREHIAAVQPDVVLGVERGGAFLAQVLGAGAGPFPPTVAVPKSVRPREGSPDLVQRIPNLEAEIRRRIGEGQTRFAIVDFYMGGVFAQELQTMIAGLHRDRPDVRFEVLWMRETHGFERAVFHPERRHPHRPTAADLREGVSFRAVGRLEPAAPAEGRLPVRLRFVDASPALVVPPLLGTDQGLPNLRATQFPVELVLGDDMRAVLDRSSDAPVRLFDRAGTLVGEIPVGTPDPVTGVPTTSTREIMIRLMEGFLWNLNRGGR